MTKFFTIVSVIMISALSAFSQRAKIEYIAHAAFVLESENGTRVLIDPYHSYNQLGYTFPESIDADFVLITHPHYDHDGSKYLSENVPVFRESGMFRFKDVSFSGIESKHGFYEQIAASGNQAYNVIWVIEIGGKRIAHLGDNQTPTSEEIAKLESVDFIIGPPNDEVLALFPDKTYIPNHYLLPQLTKHQNWMNPIDDWLIEKKQLNQLESNVFFVNEKNRSGILLFQPSPLVKEWSPAYYKALDYMRQGLTIAREPEKKAEGLALLDMAIASVPNIFQPYLNKAILLDAGEQYVELIAVLEKGLASSIDIDWGREVKAHSLLAKAYLNLEEKSKAYNHYLWIARHHRIVNTKTLEEAKTFINEYSE